MIHWKNARCSAAGHRTARILALALAPILAIAVTQACGKASDGRSAVADATTVTQAPVLFADQDALFELNLEGDFYDGVLQPGERFTDGSGRRLRSTGEYVENEDGSVDQEMTPVKVTLADAGAAKVTVQAQWQPRGGMRLNAPIFPMMLQFPKDRQGTPWAALDKKMKLVSHGDDPEKGELLDPKSVTNQKVIRETLCYAVVRAFGVPAMRTQPVKVTYTQATSGQVLTQGYGILLEHKDDIAKRLGWKELKFPIGDEDGDDYLNQPAFPVEDYTRQVLVQMAVGHSDWGPNHNAIRFVDGKGVQRLVGYDWDQCSFNHDEFDPANRNDFVAADFLESQPISEVISWREEGHPDEELDFLGAAKALAPDFLAREQAVMQAIAKADLTPKGRKLIEKRMKSYFRELRKLK